VAVCGRFVQRTAQEEKKIHKTIQKHRNNKTENKNTKQEHKNTKNIIKHKTSN
jgi:hypothetical protein